MTRPLYLRPMSHFGLQISGNHLLHPQKQLGVQTTSQLCLGLLKTGRNHNLSKTIIHGSRL